MKYTKYILSIVIPFAVAYLFSCFYNISFDISTWDKSSRFSVCLVGGFLSICGFVCTVIFNSED